jgi:hypothetical protein
VFERLHFPASGLRIVFLKHNINKENSDREDMPPKAPSSGKGAQVHDAADLTPMPTVVPTVEAASVSFATPVQGEGNVSLATLLSSDRAVCISTPAAATELAVNIDSPGVTERTISAERADVPKPFSRLEEQEAIGNLALSIGSRVSLQWRMRETLDSVASDWWITEVTIIALENDSQTNRQKFVTTFLWEDEELLGCLPLNQECEMAAISRVKGKALPSFSQPEHTSYHVPMAPTPAMRGVTQNRSTVEDAVCMSHALADVKRGRSTVELLNGDGLRLPSAIPAVFACFYPQVWLYRALQGESQLQITEMWRKSILDFKDYIGLVIRNPARRDAQLMLRMLSTWAHVRCLETALDGSLYSAIVSFC